MTNYDLETTSEVSEEIENNTEISEIDISDTFSESDGSDFDDKQMEDTLAKKRKKKKRRRIIFAAVIGLIILIVVFSAVSKLIAGKNAAKETYTDAAVERRTISNTITGSSSIEPNDSYSVTTIKSGDIISDSFKEGDTVKKGDKLYQFDDKDAANSLTSAQNAITKAQNSLSDAQKAYNDQYVTSSISGKVKSVAVKNGDNVANGSEIASVYDDTYMKIRLPFNDYDASAVNVGAEAQVTVTGSRYIIYGKVTEKATQSAATDSHTMVVYVTIEVKNPGALTERDTGSAVVNGVACSDTANFEYVKTQKITAKTSGTVNNLSISMGDGISSGQRVAAIKSDTANTALSNAQLSLEDAKLNYEKAQDAVKDYIIEAPIDGTVVKKNAKAGDTVDTGNASEPLCVIYDLSCVKLSIDVDETEIALVKTGQKATVTADAVEGEFEGEVIKVPVDGVNQNGVTTYTIEIQIDNYGDLLPGMNVDAEIVVEEAENVIAAPVNSVNRGNIVFVKDDGQTRENDVTDMIKSRSEVKEQTGKPDSKMPEADSTEHERNTDMKDIPANIEVPEGYRAIRVETGINDTEYIEIKSGLTETDTVRTINANSSSADAFFGSGQEDMQGMPGMGGGPGGGMSGGMGGGSHGGGMSGGMGGGPDGR